MFLCLRSSNPLFQFFILFYHFPSAIFSIFFPLSPILLPLPSFPSPPPQFSSNLFLPLSTFFISPSISSFFQFSILASPSFHDPFYFLFHSPNLLFYIPSFSTSTLFHLSISFSSSHPSLLSILISSPSFSLSCANLLHPSSPDGDSILLCSPLLILLLCLSLSRCPSHNRLPCSLSPRCT